MQWGRAWGGGVNLFFQDISRILKGCRDVFCGIRLPAARFTRWSSVLCAVLSQCLGIRPDTQPDPGDSCVPSPHPRQQGQKDESHVPPEEFADDFANVPACKYPPGLEVRETKVL